MVDRRLAGRYVTHLPSEGLARKSVDSQVMHLSSYWRFLVRKGVAQENPWREQSVSGDVDQEWVPWSKD
jgi:site-specific recombinase XerD